MRLLDEGAYERRGGAIGPARRPSAPLAFFCALAAWAVAAALFFVSYDPELPLPEGLAPGVWTFELVEDAHEGEFGYSAPARATCGEASCDVRVLYRGEVRYMAHERFEAYATFDVFSEANRMRFAQQGLAADAYVEGELVRMPCGALGPLVELRRWASGLFDGMQTRGAALVRALVTGDRVDLDRGGMYDDMKAIGLAHMVAVSGSHLAVVAALAGGVMKRLGVPKRSCTLLMCAFYAVYAVFTGLSAPVIRAAAMSCIVVLSFWARRRSSALAALSVCVCVLIALNPYNALSLSFFLSAASTFGVIVLTPLFASWLDRACAGRCAPACEAFALTAAASLPIAPATVAVFSRITLIAPLANLAAAPVFSLLLAGGLAALPLCAALPWAQGVVLGALSFPAELLCAGAAFAADLPYSSLPATGDIVSAGAIVACAVAVLWASWPMPRARTLRIALCAAPVVLCAWLAFAPFAAKDEVIMLDVGQGDALLVRSEGKSLLVDTGNQEQRLLAALARNGVSSIGGVLVSHHDDDHCGCLEMLAPYLAGDVLLADGAFSCGCDDCRALVDTARDVAGSGHARGLRAGDAVRVGKFSCTAVWPYGFEEEGGNADSLCLLVSYDEQGDGEPEASVLLTGDAEARQIREMLDRAGIGRVDVLKAGHHGSKAGVDEGFSRRVGSKIALVSVGESNRYGHPSAEALEEFARGGMDVFRTDEQGDVTCRFEGDAIEVFVQKE